MFYCDSKFVGNVLKQARINAKLSQCVLAERINLSEKHISNIERGLNLPSLDTFFKLCVELKLTLNDFGIDNKQIKKTDRENLLMKIFSASDEELKAYNISIEATDNIIKSINN